MADKQTVQTLPLKRQFIVLKDNTLVLEANNITLATPNRELVNKSKGRRAKKTKKHFGEAKLLSMIKE
ncbi:hypothetical protein VTI28DRAFT_6775 [Corynascus sepedonium]